MTAAAYIPTAAPAETELADTIQTLTATASVTIIQTARARKTLQAGETAATEAGITDKADITSGKRRGSMRSEQEVNRAIDRYADTVRRLCMLHIKNYADTEDIFQAVFLKYALSSVSFESDEHEKAWLIRVTINACKDLLKSFFRSRTISLDDILEQPAALPPDNREVLETVLALPSKYKDVVYLHYYEGYTAPQISRILGKNVNTVYTLLTRSRQILKERLGGDAHE